MRGYGLAATAFLLLALALAAGCSSASDTSHPNSLVPTATPLPTATFVPKVAQSGQLELTILDVQDPYGLTILEGSSSSSELRYVVIRMLTKNISAALGPVSPGTFALQDDVGTVYSEEPPAPGVHYGLFPQLAPQDTFDQSYTFQLPVARKVVALQWQPLDRTVAQVTIQLQ